MEIIVADNLSFTYPNGTQAIRNVSFSIEAGSVVAYLGPNGAGKTTTVNILTTVFPPTTGRAVVGSYDVVKDKEKVREIVAVSPQEFTLDLGLTVYENLEIYGRLCGIKTSERRQRIDQLLNDFQIADKSHTSVLALSGGQARRLQIARALLSKPRVVFLDEPTLGLDPFGVDLTLDYLRKLRDEGVTVFLASNEMEQVERICDWVIFLNNGQLVDAGPLSGFIEQYAGQEIISLTLEGTLPSDVFKDWRGAETLEVLNADNPLTLAVPRAGHVLPELVLHLTSQGVIIRDLEIRKPGLREAFVSLVKELNHHG